MTDNDSIRSLLSASAEAGVPFNVHLVHDGQATWLFAYQGPLAMRDAWRHALDALGPFVTLRNLAPTTRLEELERQSLRAVAPVLDAVDAWGTGVLVACYRGAQDVVDRLVKAAAPAALASRPLPVL